MQGGEFRRNYTSLLALTSVPQRRPRELFTPTTLGLTSRDCAIAPRHATPPHATPRRRVKSRRRDYYPPEVVPLAVNAAVRFPEAADHESPAHSIGVFDAEFITSQS